jgi:hypothetical protein
MSTEAAGLLASRRAAGRPVRSFDELEALVSPVARAALSARRVELQGRLAFAPERLRLRGAGWVEGRNPRAAVELLVAPQPGRLAILVRRFR